MPTPRPDSAPAPGADQTVRLGPGTGDGEQLRLEPGSAGEARTVRLDRGAPDPEATVRLDGHEAESATFLDPRVWGSAPRPTPPSPGADADAAATVRLGATSASGTTPVDATPDEQPLASGELRRFGPGVPPQAAAAWRGETAPEAPQSRRPRRIQRWLVPAAVLLAILALLFWRLHTPALAVTAADVTTDPAGPGCAGTAVITAAVETNGGSGTLRYRWLRSDGTTSAEIVQDLPAGAHHTDLVLRWTFEGHGSLQATATLEILSPAPRTAATSFAYHCP
ncbi:hypothetical protein ACH4E7_27945 [Kitasatospora sp. NPDC018058]|uniref:hypothetical protein n=1 Tax=Kitasatospora sp. NPDC018058 TaxID=3364025 RepID=UPI0037BFC6CF